MIGNQNQAIKIAIVGDIHDQWEEEDGIALEQMGVDLVLFVGDFGNEAVEVVRKIAALEIPKAVVMGNHDAWYTASSWGRKQSPYDHGTEDRVQQQLDLLGDTQVGYGKKDFPQLQLSVVGGRPFSWGGQKWKNKRFLRDRYQVRNSDESTEKIFSQAQSTIYNDIIFLGHNGPFGLGEHPEDICGRDWQPLGGDHGDVDLAQAIERVQNLGKNVPLVAFGHMHHRLRHTKERLRTSICTSPEKTVYLNAASVPRIIEQDGERLRNFSLVWLQNSSVTKAALVWVGEKNNIVSEKILYQLDDFEKLSNSN